MNALPHVVIVDDLITLIEDPVTILRRWADSALCRDLPTAAYYPPDGVEPPEAAIARCACCPVSAACLATALVHEANSGYRDGWWGGFSPDERGSLAAALGIVDVGVAVEAQTDLSTPGAIARHLRGEGQTIPAIAAAIGCTKRTVYRYLASTAA